MAKINNTTVYPNTTPSISDHVVGTDVSDTGNDVNGETVTFLLSDIAALINAVTEVIDDALTVPPGSPAEGDAYIVGAGATGAWAGQDGKIALQRSGAWDFITPVEGTPVYEQTSNEWLLYTGASWTPYLNQPLLTTSSPTFAGLTTNGNITVTGTVDGRDVATDGALLDSFDADLATFSVPASTTISAFGATLVDDADASAARTTLGAVGKTGTPVDNQLAIWTGSDTLEGDSELTYDGNTLIVDTATGGDKLTVRTSVANGNDTHLVLEKSRSGAQITAGDSLGTIFFRGHNGSAMTDAANIRAYSSINTGDLDAVISYTAHRHDFFGDITIPTKTPASASATGTAGEIAWDSSYIYICTATDTWMRVAIATW